MRNFLASNLKDLDSAQHKLKLLVADEEWFNDHITDVLKACTPIKALSQDSTAAAAAGSAEDISHVPLTEVSTAHARQATLILCERMPSWKLKDQKHVCDASMSLFSSLGLGDVAFSQTIVNSLAALSARSDAVALCLGGFGAQLKSAEWNHIVQCLVGSPPASKSSVGAASLLLSVSTPLWLQGLSLRTLQQLWTAIAVLPIQGDSLDLWGLLLHVVAQHLHPSHCMAAVTGRRFLAWVAAPCAVAAPVAAAAPAAASSGKAQQEDTTPNTQHSLADVLAAVVAAAGGGSGLSAPQAHGLTALAARLLTHTAIALRNTLPAEMTSGSKSPLGELVPTGVLLAIVEQGMLVGVCHPPPPAASAAATSLLHSAQLLQEAVKTASVNGSIAAMGDVMAQQHEGLLRGIAGVLSGDFAPPPVTAVAAALGPLMDASALLAEYMVVHHTVPLLYAAHAGLAAVFPAIFGQDLPPHDSRVLQFHAHLAAVHAALSALRAWAHHGLLSELSRSAAPGSLASLVSQLAFLEADGGLPFGPVRPMASYGIAQQQPLWAWGADAWEAPVAAVRLACEGGGDVACPPLDTAVWAEHLERAAPHAEESTEIASGTMATVLGMLANAQAQRQAHAGELPPQASYKHRLADDTQDDLDLEGGLPCDY